MKRIFSLLIIVSILFLMDCSKKTKGINCIVLIDYSASLPDSEFDKYVEMFRTGLLRNMSYEDQMVLIPIDEASEMKNEIIGECEVRKIKTNLEEGISPYQELSEADTIGARLNRVLYSSLSHEMYYYK